MHHTIVALERIHQPLPDAFDFGSDATYTLITHETTPTRALLHERIREATIIIVTTITLDAETLSANVAPHLRLVAVMATGTDLVDLAACKARGIRVTNCPAANIDAVSDHAIGLYFAARRRTVMIDRLVRDVPSQWKANRSLGAYLRYKDGQPPLSCKDEVMGVVGYGALGKNIAALGRALGMEVLVAARKPSSDPSSPCTNDVNPLLPPPTNTSTSTPSEDPPRTPFPEVLRRATVLILSLPRTPSTLSLLSTPEFTQMHPYAVVVNIARGGIVDEHAVLHALQTGLIAGYATDVLAVEPAEGAQDSPLLSDEAKDVNVTVSPHLAWFAQRTLRNLGAILRETVEAWVRDGVEEKNVVV
ncbi:hypothetical protein DM02DRAFT_662062 [Periconia macrospinosa]|uniref:Glycerate dehydrogenase n=1 Tax=Periconia macrospinosa TaxID=97972 RepID=A0A2V1D7X5_9PLEO|nr:hypothetical protein DM02DRAFT_662062 [Periconia macrospinosa]